MYIFFFVNTCRTCSTMYSLGRSIFCHNFHLGIARTFRQWRPRRMLFKFASLFSSSFLLIFLVFVAFLSFLQMERRIYRIIYIYIYIYTWEEYNSWETFPNEGWVANGKRKNLPNQDLSCTIINTLLEILNYNLT